MNSVQKNVTLSSLVKNMDGIRSNVRSNQNWLIFRESFVCWFRISYEHCIWLYSAPLSPTSKSHVSGIPPKFVTSSSLNIVATYTYICMHVFPCVYNLPNLFSLYLCVPVSEMTTWDWTNWFFLYLNSHGPPLALHLGRVPCGALWNFS